MITLRQYQAAHYERLLSILKTQHVAGDFSDTGTGKTVVALFLCKALDVVPLVLGPKSSRAGWERLAAQAEVEIEFCNYEKLRGRRVTRPDGTRITETQWLEEKPWGKGSFLKWKRDYELIIFDEVARCGGSTSLNSKALIAAKRQARYILCLSATAADDPRQCKALGYALDLHGLSKKNHPSRLTYMSWLLRHGCTPGVFGGFDFSVDTVKQRKAFTRLHAEIFPSRGARMRKAEIPNFPKTVIDVKWITDETGKAQKYAAKLHDSNEGKSLGDAMEWRQKLEILKVPYLVDLVEDYAQASKVVIFVNFTEPLQLLREKLQKLLGYDQVGFISGAQAGKQGDAERTRFLDLFQANKMAALVCNIQAGGESLNAHDPTGQVERTALICPCESGRQLKQVCGRVNRDGGARSLQLIPLFADTYEQTVGERMLAKGMNVDVFNDADLLA